MLSPKQVRFRLGILLLIGAGLWGCNHQGTEVSPQPALPQAAATRAAPAYEQYNGSPTDVMLQGFHWESCNYPWYKIVKDNAQVIKDAGFTVVWFPPPTKTADAHGYLPTEWYNLNTKYGTQDELKNAIQALRPVLAVADVVINHRCGTATAGVDFTNPSFADNAAAVVQNDESGAGRGTGDSGDGFDGGRDLDHSDPSVQTEIVKWLNWLKTDMGFAGWRYDLVKGYDGKYVGQYNDETKPTISVGEYWDYDRQKVVNWADATKGRSMAFDFPTREQLRQALANQDFVRLKTVDGKPTGVIGWWPAMSVTFVDNHDSEPMRNREPFPADKVLQGYAYVLTHPGVPCVFWRHYFDWGEPQKQKLNTMIGIRKQSGINSRSVVNIVAADGQKYAAIIDGKVAMKIGPGSWSPGAGWHVAADGNDFAVWLRD